MASVLGGDSLRLGQRPGPNEPQMRPPGLPLQLVARLTVAVMKAMGCMVVMLLGPAAM